MGTEIYYFTGTGNSLAVARDIALKSNGKLISIVSVMDKEKIKTDADAIGIIFPVYFRAVLGGIPQIISRFVGKLENAGSKYIYAVCTYGLGKPDFRILDKSIQQKGGKLSAGFAVKMPFYYLALNGFATIKNPEQEELYDVLKKKMECIYEIITSKKQIKINSGNKLINTLVVPPGKLYYYLMLRKLTKQKLPIKELLLWMDCGFQAEAKCDGCGICSKICPVTNIEMVSHKPLWHHRCEQCTACVQWCPKGAILIERKSVEGRRFHHPDVYINNLMVDKN